MAKDLARAFGSLTGLEAATPEEMEAIDGIGPSLSASVTAWFADDRNRQLVDGLRQRGIDPVEESRDAGTDLPLTGTVFVITGSLGRSRREMKSLLEDLGAKVVGSVSGKTTHLLAGDGAGSKLTKAKDLGVEVLDEEALEDLVSRKGGAALWPM